jgi:hypothetical protein
MPHWVLRWFCTENIINPKPFQVVRIEIFLSLFCYLLFVICYFFSPSEFGESWSRVMPPYLLPWRKMAVVVNVVMCVKLSSCSWIFYDEGDKMKSFLVGSRNSWLDSSRAQQGGLCAYWWARTTGIGLWNCEGLWFLCPLFFLFRNDLSSYVLFVLPFPSLGLIFIFQNYVSICLGLYVVTIII